MPRVIPERLPIGDALEGVVIDVESAHALALEAVPGAHVVYNGQMVARYGIRYLGKPHLSVVPYLIAIDYGDILNGEAAWEFLTRRSNLYPRAEVFGFRSDGRDEMIVVKLLDLALPIDVLLYADHRATTPIARPSALLASADAAAALPSRLLMYLPRYDTLKEWRQQ
jgi:hypothetical protein